MRIVAGDGVFLNTAFRRLLLAFENRNAALLFCPARLSEGSAACSKQIADVNSEMYLHPDCGGGVAL
jgi:hypothetical protein